MAGLKARQSPAAENFHLVLVASEAHLLSVSLSAIEFAAILVRLCRGARDAHRPGTIDNGPLQIEDSTGSRVQTPIGLPAIPAWTRKACRVQKMDQGNRASKGMPFPALRSLPVRGPDDWPTSQSNTQEGSGRGVCPVPLQKTRMASASLAWRE